LSARLKSRIGLERKLFLAFLQADPLEVFQRLFMEKGVAPKFVCLHTIQQNGALANLLRDAGAARPNYVVGKWPETHAPWTMLWQKYRSWDDTAVFQQRNDPAHELQDAVEYEHLNCVSTPMNPDSVEGAHVVHLTVQDYLAHHWPDHIACIFIDADREQLPAEFWADDPRLSPLRLSGLPMSEALPKLGDACNAPNLPNAQAIHTGRFGFEDEGVVLRHMWPNRWSLTIHCETIGDMDSLQGFVCGDLP